MPGAPKAQISAEAWLNSAVLAALLRRVAMRYRIGAADLDDLAQETKIALWEAGTDVVGAAWVLRVASNKAVDLIRRRTKALVHEKNRSSPANSHMPELDLKLLLHARVMQLPPPLRDFYDLHYVQGWSEREIARRLGKCRASVRWLDRRCRQSLVGRS